MNLWELTAPCHFGTEAVLKREILDLGYEVTKVEDGRVTFEADARVWQTPICSSAPQNASF